MSLWTTRWKCNNWNTVYVHIIWILPMHKNVSCSLSERRGSGYVCRSLQWVLRQSHLAYPSSFPLKTELTADLFLHLFASMWKFLSLINCDQHYCWTFGFESKHPIDATVLYHSYMYTYQMNAVCCTLPFTALSGVVNLGHQMANRSKVIRVRKYKATKGGSNTDITHMITVQKD